MVRKRRFYNNQCSFGSQEFILQVNGENQVNNILNKEDVGDEI